MSSQTVEMQRRIINARSIAMVAREQYLEATPTPIDDAFSTLISAINELCDGVEIMRQWMVGEECRARAEVDAIVGALEKAVRA